MIGAPIVLSIRDQQSVLAGHLGATPHATQSSAVIGRNAVSVIGNPRLYLIHESRLFRVLGHVVMVVSANTVKH